MIITERQNNIADDIEWKEFLRNQYSLFFDSRFLAYNDRFEKKILWHHLKFKDSETSKVLAIMIGCETNEAGRKNYFSCHGVSFGGFLWKKKIDLLSYLSIADSFKKYLRENGFESCTLRNPPLQYQKSVNEETEFALVKSGFKVTGVSITNITDLEQFEFRKISETKRRSIRKSAKEIEVRILEGRLNKSNFGSFYKILLENREMKNVNPTHTIDELMYLKNTLPDDIVLFEANINGGLAAICVLFAINKDVILNFYLACSEEYKTKGVSEFILYETIEWSKKKKYRYYDIGTSDTGGVLNEGLFAFKKKFLANGFLRKTYTINLKNED